MADYGVVETGFIVKRYIDIKADMDSRARANWGETVVTDTNKPLGKFFDVLAWELDLIWQELDNLYQSIGIDSAEGIALDRLVKYKGLRRYTDSYATGQIQITGTPNTLVAKNFLVGKANGVIYRTTNAGTIPDSGVLLLNITSDVIGTRGNAEIGEINLIISPQSGVTSVTNPRVIGNGTDYETDVQLRFRYLTTVGGLSTVESIRATVAAVEGVSSVIVIENPTMSTVNGIPPKAFEVYVFGGNDDDIAQAILDSKAAGIEAYGTTIIEVYDVNNYPHQIGFTRADAITINVQVNVTKNQYYPIDGDTQIKEAITNYIGGVSPSGTQHIGLTINENVILSKITSLVWNVRGVDDVEVLLFKTGDSPAATNVIIGEFEIARTSYDVITITAVTT